MNRKDLEDLLATQPVGTIIVMVPTKGRNERTYYSAVAVKIGDGLWKNLGDRNEDYGERQVVDGITLGAHTWSLS